MRILVVLFFALCPILGFAQEVSRPKIALVLSGGGAKGFAHIGVLKVLEKEGIPIDIIVGTSMGAVVGGLYAIGYSADEIEYIAKSQNWEHLLSDDISRVQSSQFMKDEQQKYLISFPINAQHQIESPEAALQGYNALNLFCNLAGNVPVNADFKNFPIRFACVGTDIGTGKEVVIEKGFLPTAIYASMTIPGVFSPIEHEGYKMIDGGVVNNFPTDVAKRMGADIVIGVDLRSGLCKADDIKTAAELLNQIQCRLVKVLL
jgi:NTE family protein